MNCGRINHLTVESFYGFLTSNLERVGIGMSGILLRLGLGSCGYVPCLISARFGFACIDLAWCGWLRYADVTLFSAWIRRIKENVWRSISSFNWCMKFYEDLFGLDMEFDEFGDCSGFFVMSVLTCGTSFFRPVAGVETYERRYIGAIEQEGLGISGCGIFRAIESRIGHYGTVELSEVCPVSRIAVCIPFASHNHSPRNIYQCQMESHAIEAGNCSILLSVSGKTLHLWLSISTLPQHSLRSVFTAVFSRWYELHCAYSLFHRA